MVELQGPEQVGSPPSRLSNNRLELTRSATVKADSFQRGPRRSTGVGWTFAVSSREWRLDQLFAMSQWFSPSQSDFMINYRVDSLGDLLAQLRAAGVEVVRGPE